MPDSLLRPRGAPQGEGGPRMGEAAAGSANPAQGDGPGPALVGAGGEEADTPGVSALPHHHAALGASSAGPTAFPLLAAFRARNRHRTPSPNVNSNR